MIQDLPADFWLSVTMQEIGDGFRPLMVFFTLLGYPQAYMVIIALIYWSVDRKLGLRLAVFLPVAASLNSILKQLFHSPRPFWLYPEIKAIRPTGGFGMPSGHAQASTVWLYAAALRKRNWIWMTAVFVVCMVGLSRVYLGVHFSSQVLSGWLLGILILILFTRLEGIFLSWFLSKRLIAQLVLIIGFTIGIMTLGGLFVYFLKEWEAPMAWINHATDDLAGMGVSIGSSVGMEAISGYAGGILGVALGALFSHRNGGFDPGGPVWRRLLRCIAGLVGLSAIYAITMWIAPEENRELLFSIWRFSSFFTISFFAIYLFPVLFRRTVLFSPAVLHRGRGD